MALELDKFRPETATPLEVAQLWASHTDLMRARVAAVRERKALESVLTDLLASYENYASQHKPKEEWDDYDAWMFPKWEAARAALARMKETSP